MRMESEEVNNRPMETGGESDDVRLRGQEICDAFRVDVHPLLSVLHPFLVSTFPLLRLLTVF